MTPNERPDTIGNLVMACIDPDGPLYGSDIVPWIDDLIESHRNLVAMLRKEAPARDSRIAALESRLREVEGALRKYGTHRNSCKAYPATSDEQVARDCDCGLQAALVARYPVGQ